MIEMQEKFNKRGAAIIEVTHTNTIDYKSKDKTHITFKDGNGRQLNIFMDRSDAFILASEILGVQGYARPRIEEKG